MPKSKHKKLEHAMKELRKAAAALPEKKKLSEEGLVKRTRRRLKELWYGEKTYLPKKKKKKSKGSKNTVRTKDITDQLKTAGLTDKEIKRLRGKK